MEAGADPGGVARGGGGSAWGRGAVGAMMEASRGEMCGGGVPLPTRGVPSPLRQGMGRELCPSTVPSSIIFFLIFELKRRVLVHSGCYFLQFN